MAQQSPELHLKEQERHDKGFWGKPPISDGWGERRVTRVLMELLGVQSTLVAGDCTGMMVHQRIIPEMAANRARLLNVTGFTLDRCGPVDKRVETLELSKDELSLANGHLASYATVASGLVGQEGHLQHGVRHLHVAVMSLGVIFGIDVDKAHAAWLSQNDRANHWIDQK